MYIFLRQLSKGHIFEKQIQVNYYLLVKFFVSLFLKTNTLPV
jgi:hypothetical protein